MRSQKEAVCTTLMNVLSERGIDYELNGDTTIKDVLTPADKEAVRKQIISGFVDGSISISEDARSKHIDNGFVSYTNGVVNNWIKKNPEFNSGVKYAPANPGSRTGQGDETIQALRGLLKGNQTPESITEIETAIAERLAEIKPSAVVTINVDALPEHLKHLAK